jgi:hypothetical protein
MVDSISEAEETLDLMPDRDGQRHACDEEHEEHEPEPDPRAPCAPAMRRTGLPAGSMEAHGVSKGLVIDDGDVIRPCLTRLLRHGRSVGIQLR